MTSSSSPTLKIQLRRFNVPVSSKVTLSCQQWFLTDASNQAHRQKIDSCNNDDDNNQRQERASTRNKSATCVVFCHQYGKMGGSGGLLISMAQRLILESVGIRMNNNRTTQLPNANFVNLLSNALDCVTFDMRGVGHSSGSATFTCSDEVEDVTAVCNFLVKNEGYSRLFLVGSSAGAVIAGSALDSCKEIVACAVIGYTFGWAASILFSSHYSAFQHSVKPKLLIHGTDDGFTSNSQFEDLMKKLGGDFNDKVIIDGVGHFEMEQPNYDAFMAEQIFAFFRKFF